MQRSPCGVEATADEGNKGSGATPPSRIGGVEHRGTIKNPRLINLDGVEEGGVLDMKSWNEATGAYYDYENAWSRFSQYSSNRAEDGGTEVAKKRPAHTAGGSTAASLWTLEMLQGPRLTGPRKNGTL